MGILDTPATKSLPWLYLPKGWDAQWKADLAASATTPCWALIDGDSIGAGQNAPTYLTGGFFGLWRADVLARAGSSLYGDHYPLWSYSSTFNAPGASPWGTVSGSPAATSAGFGKTVALDGSGSVTFTLPYTATSLELVHVDRTAGTFTVTPSTTGTAQTVTTTGAGTNSGAKMKKTTVAGGPFPSGSTITIGGESATNVALISGISTYAATAGVGFARNVWQGLQMANHTDTSSFPTADKIALWTGTSAASFSGFPVGAGLVLIELGVNDCSVYGPAAASAQGRSVADGVTTNASATLTSATASFSQSDVYAPVVGAGIPAGAYIKTVSSTTSVTLSANATATATAVALAITRPPQTTQFRDGLRRKIAAYRQAKPNASICLLIMSYPDSLYSDMAINSAGTWWHLYKTVIHEVARAYQCAVVDVDAKWGGTSLAQGFHTAAGDVHPGASGHADIFALLKQVA